jgi:hypothetical protein
MSVKKFEGSINGKIYTDDEEFDKVLSEWDNSKDITVSYKYITVPDDVNDTIGLTQSNCDNVCNNFISEKEYIKTISNKNEVVLDNNLIDKLKNASNKLEIFNNICKKIEYFDNRINDNLLHINELNVDCETLERSISNIKEQIKVFNDANNNYYLQKEYYKNIENLLNTPIEDNETKKESVCSCKCNKDNEVYEKYFNDILKCLSNSDDITKYLNKDNNCSLSNLLDIFLKKY